MAELTEALTRHFNFVAKVRKPYLGVTAVDALTLSYIVAKVKCGACGEATTGTYKCNGCNTIICDCGACDCWRSPKLSLVPSVPVPFTQAELDEMDKIEAEAAAEVKEEYAQMAADEDELYDSDSEDRRDNDDGPWDSNSFSDDEPSHYDYRDSDNN
jgi:hypothetical protein